MISETSDIKEVIISNFKNIESEINGKSQSPFHEVKKDAIAALSELDFPSTKHEEWKYTDISKALKKNFDFAKSVSSVEYSLEDIEKLKFPELDATYLVFINGKFSKELSDHSKVDKSLLIEDLGTAYNQNNSIVREHFSKYADYKKDIFTALSTAFAEEGLFIRVFDGAIIEKPIVFLFISDSSQGNTISQPRNLICVGKNCQATLIENYISKGANPQFTNTVSEIVVSEQAMVDYYKIQNEPEQTYHVGTTQVYQAKTSYFSSTTITLNGGIVRNNLNIKLDGERAECKMNGLYQLNGKAHVDNHTTVDHAKPHTLSNELYKGILDGKSTGVFNGKIFVRQDAQKTNAFQSNRNVLLSDEASINTKPQLEIWADDVKCSHGATTGQMDEEALFYLRSRGISKDRAKSLLMIAFASEVVNTIKIKAIKTYIEQLILDSLHI